MTAEGARSIIFVLASWRVDAPAGIERATAALAAGLAVLGHRAVIVTAVGAGHGPRLPGVTMEHLKLPVAFPCDDQVLRKVLLDSTDTIQSRLREIVTRHRADTVVFTDALWGLGRLAADLPPGVRRVLAAHVLPNPEDAPEALARADTVIIPSGVVQAEAQRVGLPAKSWQVVPNALLYPSPLPGSAAIERRRCGPVRVLARLGREKGLAPLLRAAAHWHRPLEITVAPAGFEAADGAQATLLDECRTLTAAADNITLHEHGLAWRDVPNWLGDAAAVIVPSLRETFGLVALEAMSGATPVISYRVGNLPTLLEPANRGVQLLGNPQDGANTLLRLAEALLQDPIAYERTAKAMYHLAQDYRPDRIAQLFLKAVS